VSDYDSRLAESDRAFWAKVQQRKTVMDEQDAPISTPTKEEVVDPQQIGMFSEPQAPPTPPTGPVADPYSREEGKPHAFIKFMESEDGPLFWQALENAALDAFKRQETRFSPRGFLAHYRDTKKVRINNNFSPWFADQLVAEHPQLLDLIERRVRKKEGPSIQSNK